MTRAKLLGVDHIRPASIPLSDHEDLLVRRFLMELHVLSCGRHRSRTAFGIASDSLIFNGHRWRVPASSEGLPAKQVDHLGHDVTMTQVYDL